MSTKVVVEDHLLDYLCSHRTGYLPDCRMSFCKGFTQGGSNADVVLADAYVKNVSAGIDWRKGYEAVVKNAEGNSV